MENTDATAISPGDQDTGIMPRDKRDIVPAPTATIFTAARRDTVCAKLMEALLGQTVSL
ncbi:MAG: hypothetical protein ACR2P9_06665 [Gammaproteobacteria bacterium]